ncbi:MAG TPA: YCF48-related protein [Puia sp.]|nr:YCF48-related protein [Puia sp.]
MRISLTLIFVFVLTALSAQHIELLANNSISIRGLSVVNDKIIWVSGTNGTVGKSINGGKTWEWMIVKDFEKKDFRDIEAFDENTAVIMAIDEPANILKTIDGGKTWKLVFTDSTKGMFLDAMDFSGKKGVVIGDPVNQKIFLAYTEDGGDSWKISSILNNIAPAEGEAFFASSGTNIRVTKKNFIPIFVSGGTKSSIYNSSTFSHILPIEQGQNSTGANSIALSPDNEMKGIVVGGDFKKDTATKNNCVLFSLLPFSVHKPNIPPHGYRSCVEYITENKLICCGTSGVDISEDGGMNWKLISKESFHVCAKAKKGNAVFLAGANGKIAQLIE